MMSSLESLCNFLSHMNKLHFFSEQPIQSSCKYVFKGDGRSSSEGYLGHAVSLEQCYEMVTEQYPSANGLTMLNPARYTGTSYPCYAEMEMFGWPGVNEWWISCFKMDGGV